MPRRPGLARSQLARLALASRNFRSTFVASKALRALSRRWGARGGAERSPETTSGAIGGSFSHHCSSDFVVDPALGRKTPNMQSVCAMAIGLRVAPSATDPQIVRKSLWEGLASDCPKSTLTKVDLVPPRRTFWSFRGVRTRSGGVPRRSRGAPRALRAPPGAPRERPRSLPNRLWSARGPPGAIWDDFWLLVACVRACVRARVRARVCSLARLFVCSFLRLELPKKKRLAPRSRKHERARRSQNTLLFKEI